MEGRAVNKLFLCAALAAVVSTASGAAMAQAALPAHEIASILRSAGLTPISPALRRGDFYVLRAAGRGGRELRVIVSARSGEIRSALPVARAAAGGERLAPHE